MEKNDSILTNFKRIDYEGLKLEQSLMDSDNLNVPVNKIEELVNFESIYFGLISMN